jgi:hypothetical protein
MNIFSENGTRKVSPLMAMLAFIAIMVLLFYVAKGVFWILSFVAPVLFLITLVINRHVVFDYGRSLMKLTKTNPFMGIAAIVLSFVAFPLVSAFLFGKALLMKKVDSLKDNLRKEEEAEFTEYEEIEEDDPLVLDDLEPLKEKEILKESNDSEYDDLFN